MGLSDRAKLLAKLADIDRIIRLQHSAARAKAKAEARALVAEFRMSKADVFGASKVENKQAKDARGTPPRLDKGVRLQKARR